MIKSESNSGNNFITAHFVYRQPITIEQSSSDMPIEQSSVATTFIFSNHPLTYENKLNGIRTAQEQLLSGKSDPSNESESKEDIPENQNNLPKSCFTIFKLGVINNLKETGKCFGLNK